MPSSRQLVSTSQMLKGVRFWSFGELHFEFRKRLNAGFLRYSQLIHKHPTSLIRRSELHKGLSRHSRPQRSARGTTSTCSVLPSTGSSRTGIGSKTKSSQALGIKDASAEEERRDRAARRCDRSLSHGQLILRNC